jgi:predicted PurR-regulated permease PerM
MSKPVKKTIRQKLSDYFRANLGIIILLAIVITFAVIIENSSDQIILKFSQQPEAVLSVAVEIAGVWGIFLGVTLVLLAILIWRLVRALDDADKYQNQKPQKLFEYNKTMSKRQNKYIGKILVVEFILAIVVMIAGGIVIAMRNDSSILTNSVLLATYAEVSVATFFIWYFYGKSKGLIRKNKGRKK